MGVEEQRAGKFYVERDVLDELCLDQVARRRTHSATPPLKERVKDSLRCSMPKLKRSVLSTFPVLSWLPRYSVRDNGLGDLISGISVGIMHLPQGMAYALLASVPPVFGLYTSFYPVLVYCILGTSRHISIGTFAVISIMIGSVTERLAPDSDFTFLNGTNGTAGLDVTARDAYRVQIAASTTVLCGLFQVLLGMVRFGFVVTYLSEPLVRGYTTGAATHVVVSQLKYIFGIHPARFSGPLSQVYILIDICRHLPETNIGALVISLVALLVLIVVKELNSCYEKKLPLPIPIELIVIIAATLISYYGNLNSQYDVAVVGEIPRGLKSPSLPDVSLWGTVVGDAFAVAIVGYAINISLGKTFGLKHGYKVDSNQELVALGLSNTVGGFFQCYSVTSSMSRSLIQESTGGRTQVAGVVSSVIVLITVLQLGTLFEELPKAVLSCIVFVNLKGMFKQYLDIPALWKSNTVDLLVWLVTLVCTILLNLDLGLAASIAFSLLTVIFRTQLPRYSILGQVPGTELYLDTDTYEEAKEIPGITIFRSSTTVYYTNAELYLDALQKKSGIDIGKLLTRKKKRDAKQKRKDEKEEKKAKKEAKKQNGVNGHIPNGTVHPEDKVDVEKGSPNLKGNRTDIALTDRPTNGQVNWAYEQQWTRLDLGSETGSHGDDAITQTSSTVGEEQRGRSSDIDTHTIILDLSTASFVDTVTVMMLNNIFRDYREIDIDIYLAGCQVCVVEQLSRASFFSESITKSRLFTTVHDAVLHSLRLQGASDVPIYECALDMACTTKM
ncbi:solute carrier family 26 member 6 [Salmo salar]|uniref:Solute carrier family 26 member 6 n=1 Tax=Salmo salar TaxID=8030 RepID=A0A1S3LGU3_SALSA|nr:solute carrier family 26 member 6 [Salmo salar]|eukprot:XP_013990168.1 PREDICTED: solute carrier family 26 member 6-like [Salmo salar]